MASKGVLATEGVAVPEEVDSEISQGTKMALHTPARGNIVQVGKRIDPQATP